MMSFQNSKQRLESSYLPSISPCSILSFMNNPSNLFGGTHTFDFFGPIKIEKWSKSWEIQSYFKPQKIRYQKQKTRILTFNKERIEALQSLSICSIQPRRTHKALCSPTWWSFWEVKYQFLLIKKNRSLRFENNSGQRQKRDLKE